MCELVQDVEVTFMGKTFLALVIKEDLEGVELMEIKIPWQWITLMNSANLVIGGRIDILAGGNLGRLFPDQVDKHEDLKLYKSNFTDKFMVFGRQGRGDFPNMALVRKFSCTTEIEASLLGLIREDEYVHPESRDRLNKLSKQEAQAEIIENIRIDEDNNTMHISYIYDEEKLRNLSDLT